MWTTWTTIHESYGLPRAANDLRQYLELNGIRVRLSNQKQGTLRSYSLQVPIHQKENALLLLGQYKRTIK
ncbi:hypothetical protein ACI7RC_04730 [Brevibacillus sp. B_LB10_24]|uniref:hypothetical protein n=1 Tax=Brevibacillus sp. B_LB10_24 TaxID=3380645 RepID=UPI0038BAB411